VAKLIAKSANLLTLESEDDRGTIRGVISYFDDEFLAGVVGRQGRLVHWSKLFPSLPPATTTTKKK